MSPSANVARVVTYSVVGGLCPLVPIPFVDDVILYFLRRSMIRGVVGAEGVVLTREHVRHLAKRPSGCLLGCLWSVVVAGIKRLFRKIVYFLAVKSAIDTASALLHEGLLLQYAAASGHLDVLEKQRLEDVGRAIHEVCQQTDTSPFTQILRRAFRGSRVMWRRSARQVVRLLRRYRKAPDREDAVASEVLAQDAVGGLVEELTVEVWARRGYILDLQEVYERALGRLEAERAGEE